MRSSIVLLLLISLMFSVSLAGAENVLKGKVNAHSGPVRIARPAMPSVDLSASSKGSGSGGSKGVIDFGDMDFAAGLHKDFGKIDMPKPLGRLNAHTSSEPSGKPVSLDSSAEEAELVIAWEAWHKRVCSAIYERWMNNSKIGGVAHTTIRVTRDRRISVTLHDIEIAPWEMAHLPRDYHFMEEKLREEFMREVQDSVDPLNGTSVLDFPSKSNRAETSFKPYFRKEGEAGYDWRTDDFERVRR